jgi:hypothetical protein
MTSILEYYNYITYGPQNRRKNNLLLSSVINFDPIPTDPSVVWGCDFSGDWDGIVNMQTLKNRGASFVIIKCVNGTIDTKFYKENLLAAKQAGLVVGAYFWLYRNQRISGTSQANAWWNSVKDYNLDFYVCDFEWTSWLGKPDNPNTGDLWGVTQPFEKLSNQKMWIYSAKGYLDQFFNHSDIWKNNPFIIAQYGVSKPDNILPWGSNYAMWQQSDQWDGSQLGVDPHNSRMEDGDIYNGSIDDFNKRFNINQNPIPNPVPNPVSVKYNIQINNDGSYKIN